MTKWDCAVDFSFRCVKRTPSVKLGLIWLFLLISGVPSGLRAAGKTFGDLPPRLQYWANYPVRNIDKTTCCDEVCKGVADATRSAAYTAVGLLFRDAPHDRELAAEILDRVLGRQYVDLSDKKSYGVWKTCFNNESELDQNWREFVGLALIIILEEFPEKIPDSLKSEIKKSLIRAGEGALWRDVSEEYSNIAIKSAFLMEYVGKMADRQDIYDCGRKKVKDIYDLYNQHHCLSEFNSPTYAGVSLEGLACWRKYGVSEQTRRMGAELERYVWEDVADFYNPNLLNLCGPYFRNYDMDMTRCVALSGEWITVAVNDETLEPLPAVPAVKDFELALIPLVILLSEELPDELVSRFCEIKEPRFVQRDVYNQYPGDRIKKVTACIHPGWMMGGSTGHRRAWNQIMPATLHWKDPQSKHVNWLLVPSHFKTDAVVDRTSMSIFAGGIDTDKLVLLVSASSLNKDWFKKSRWDLPGLSLEIETTLPAPDVKEIKGKELRDYAYLAAVSAIDVYTGKADFLQNDELHYGVLAIEYSIPSKPTPETLLLKINPAK